MIVSVQPDGSLLLVRQTDHAAASAQVAAAWRRPAALSDTCWAGVCKAVAIHDDGWREAETFPALDAQGRPLDFLTLPTAQHIAIWRRGIDLAEHTDRYAALLVAQHARTLYTQRPDETDPADQRLTQGFLNEMASFIDQCIDELRRPERPTCKALEPHNLMIASRLMSAFDTLTLMLPGGLPWAGRFRQLACGEALQDIHVHRPNARDPRVRIDPWPFESPQVAVEVSTIRSKQTRFTDPDELSRMMAQTPPKPMCWTLIPA